MFVWFGVVMNVSRYFEECFRLLIGVLILWRFSGCLMGNKFCWIVKESVVVGCRKRGIIFVVKVEVL